MVKYIKKIPLKIWFFLFALSLLVFSIVGPSIVAAKATGAAQYDHDHSSLRGAVITYHKNMNDIMNDYTEKLLKGGADTTAPASNDSVTVEETCGDANNVSTYCLSYKMTQEYLYFIEAMTSTDSSSHSQHFQDKTTWLTQYAEGASQFYEKIDVLYKLLGVMNIVDGNKEYQTLRVDQAIERQNERQQLIIEQIQLAEQVMKVAVDTYDKLMIYYELHKAYAGVLEDLEGYRDELADIRRQVEKYPANFQNASTTDCT